MKLRTRRRIIKRHKTTKIYKETSIRKLTKKILSLPIVQDVLYFIEDCKREGIKLRLSKIMFLPNKEKR